MLNIYELTLEEEYDWEPMSIPLGFYVSKELAVKAAKKYIEKRMKDENIDTIDCNYDDLVNDGYMDVSELDPEHICPLSIQLGVEKVFESLDEFEENEL